MKNLVIIVGLILFSLAVIITVNETSPLPTRELSQKNCTRHCHDKGCIHYQEEEVSPFLLSVYKQNIYWLKQNPFGLSYKEMNLLLYVIIAPFLIIVLLWGLIRKKHG